MSAETPTSGFRRAGLTVLLGNAAGVGVALLLTPVLSRLVTPGVFGTFMTLTAVASVFVGLSTMCLEVASQAETDEDEARSTLGLAMTLAIGFGAVITVASAVAWVLGLVSVLALAAGPMVTIASMQLVGGAWLARRRAYGTMARANFTQNGGMAVAQSGLASVSPTAGALVAGFLVARLAWVRHIPALLWRRADIVHTWRRHQGYALTAGPSVGINSLASQIPILVPAIMYGDQAAGWFAMAVRILIGPLSMVGQAAGAAAVGEISQAIRSESLEASQVLRRGLRDLALVGAVPAVLAGAFGTTVVPLLLGSDWDKTGSIVALLAVGAWAQFVVAPFSHMLNVVGQHRRLLAWDISRLVLVALGFLVPGLLGLGILAAAVCYSAVMLCLYAALAYLCDRALADV